MLGGILVIILTAIVSFVFIEHVKQRFPVIDAAFLKRLFFFHLLMALAYYGYVLFNPSDSRNYYFKVVNNLRGEAWSDYYDTSTPFIEFVAYPFIKFFGFSYEAMMVLFAFFGFLGFIYFYIFFKENIRFRHTFLGVNLLTLIFYLPSLHFWSASLGKGAVIFLGIGLFFFGISNLKDRLIPTAIGALIIYHVRPHIMLLVLVSSAIGFVFSSKAVSLPLRLAFLSVAAVVFFFIYQDVLQMVGIEEDELFTQGLDLSVRARELTKATSGIDIASYSLPFKIFTFLYRPLFFDAPGVLGLLVSFENLFYLAITLVLLSKLKGWIFLLKGNFLHKSALVSFLTASFALAQISGNLGLAMRQKSQVMILLLFVIISFLDEQKLMQWQAAARKKLRMEKINRILSKSD